MRKNERSKISHVEAQSGMINHARFLGSTDGAPAFCEWDAFRGMPAGEER